MLNIQDKNIKNWWYVIQLITTKTMIGAVMRRLVSPMAKQ